MPISAPDIARVFKAIREQRWADAQIQLDRDEARPAPRDRARRALHRQGIAQGRTSRRSSRCWPRRPNCRRPAARAHGQARAARSTLPPCPPPQRLIWVDGAPVRAARQARPGATLAAAELALKMQPFIKADDGPRPRRCSRSHARPHPRSADRMAAAGRVDLFPPGRRQQCARDGRQGAARRRRLGGPGRMGRRARRVAPGRLHRRRHRPSSASRRAPATSNCARPGSIGRRAPT